MRGDNTAMDRGAIPMTNPTMYVATLWLLAYTIGTKDSMSSSQN